MTRQDAKTIGFIGWSAAYLGFTPGTAEESQLKVATVFYDQLILPVLRQQLDGVIRHFSSDERIPPNGPEASWVPVDHVAPDIEPGHLFRQLVMHDDENC
jgi:hypothetical protein